jgi:hypothetical protein
VEGFGQEKLAASFHEALQAEEGHLVRVRRSVTAMTRDLAFGEDEGPEPQRASETERPTEKERQEARTASARRESRSSSSRPPTRRTAARRTKSRGRTRE